VKKHIGSNTGNWWKDDYFPSLIGIWNISFDSRLNALHVIGSIEVIAKLLDLLAKIEALNNKVKQMTRIFIGLIYFKSSLQVS